MMKLRMVTLLELIVVELVSMLVEKRLERL